MAMPQRTHVVLVHGLGSSAQMWQPFRDLLTADPELAGLVGVHAFAYRSPRVRLRPDRRIGDLDDIADRLGTWLRTNCADGAPVVLVSHSQGGLVIQRFLARTLQRAHGRHLVHIKHVVMFACPHNGSGFLLWLRTALLLWRHPQERELRPLRSRALLEAQQAVLERVVGARRASDTECPVPLSAFGGESDNVVPSYTAVNPYRGGVIEGDHFSIVRPADRRSESYRELRRVLLDVTADASASSGSEPDGASRSAPSALSGALPQGGAYAPPFQHVVPAPRQPPDQAREEDAPFSVDLPHADGVLHGERRRNIVSTIASAESGVHVLAGPGGSGKSRLALEIAARADAGNRRVWWIRVNQLSACMRQVARDLGIPDSQADEAWKGNGSQTDLVWRALNRAAEPWLIVFDNADDPARLGPRGGQVEDATGWLRPPRGTAGTVVVTSRIRDEDVWGSWSHVHRVPLLDASDGAALLLDRAGTDAGTEQEARLLSVDLGGLPLALRTAATYVRSVRASGVTLGAADIKDFASYRTAWARRFAAPAGTRTGDGGESLGLEKIVDKVYGISLGLLERRELPQAAPLLKAFACLNIAPIPYGRLLDGAAVTGSPLWADFPLHRRREVIMGLHDLELVEVDQRRNMLSLHPVVHGILRDDPDVRRRPGDYYALNVRMLLDAVRSHNPDYPDAWPVWATVTTHAMEVARAVLRPDGPVTDRHVLGRAVELARLTCRYLLIAGHLGPARNLLFPIIGDCGAYGFGHDSPEILGLRHEKGRIHLEGGELQAAEAELRLVVEHRTGLFADRHPDTLASRHKLARAILEQSEKRAPEAEDILRSVVADEKWVRGEEHADTMVVRHTLARAILSQGRAADAEGHLRRILAVRLRLRRWPAATPETLHVRETLARSLLEQEKVSEAVALIEEARQDAAQPDDSHPVMRLRYCGAYAHLLQGQVELATGALGALLDDQSRVLGASHPEARLTQDLLERVRNSL
ncbi:alpha/beta hydrolase [Streptomyces tropicalis]|uniref:Tetratricopeptide repeat protein n=1 Tax=Streptomyces tropicalis TaxID=3034234 RepID=A0ABT6A7W6_9ACTN|nr:alpha/beta fold hydrolase [Streptomyces tropicalis]MDF3300736.1 tetratricopeptide repeat protein [Streptomyces tropicalis]